MAKEQRQNETIYFGQDLTSIDDAWVMEPNAKGVVRVNDTHKERLWGFLQECNKKLRGEDADKSDNIIIVGHSEGKKALLEKRNYSLTSNYIPQKDRDADEEIELSSQLKTEETQNPDNTDSESSEETEQRKDYRRFGQLVGTIRGRYGKKKIKVIIFSRFDSIDPKNFAESKPYFLASLLLKGKLKFSRYAAVDFNHESLFDFYMIWVMKQHFEEAIKKGCFKKYQRFERNDDKLKGPIDIARHIKMNMGLDLGKVAYSYRENSTDNIVNHLILAAYDYLEEKYPQLVMDNFDNELEMQVRSLKYDSGYPKYDRRTIINKNMFPIAHPFYTEYRLLQEDCLKILRDEGVSPFGSKDESVDGVLYYVPDLWEEYLEDYITAALKTSNRERKNADNEESELSLHLESQKEIKVMTGMDKHTQRNLEKANKNSGGHSTYPDYVFSYQESDSESKNCFFVLDAKYKYYWPKALNGKLDPEVLGDYDKCIRDMESIGGTGTGVMFPICKNELDNLDNLLQYRHRFSVFNSFKTFYTLPVEIPDKQTSFSEWDSLMRSNIKKVMNYLNKVLILEAYKKKELDKAKKRINKKLEKLEKRFDWGSISWDA